MGIHSGRELMKVLLMDFVMLLGLHSDTYIIRRLSMQGIEKVYKDGTNDGFTVCPFQCR